MAKASDIESVLAALRGHDRFTVTAHENPDGDALGSLLATHLILGALGKDSVMVLPGDAPLPAEYGFLGLEENGLLRERPSDQAERVLVAVDCANVTRIADPSLLEAARLSVNVDHHHDNTCYADVNLVVPEASSTGEMLADIAHELDVGLTPQIAEALYVALVTDTGRFQYTNTTPKALRLAADLVEAGADVRKVFQSVWETVQFAKLKLLARVLDRAQVFDEGRIVISYLLRGDFAEVGAEEPYSEGVIDYLRKAEGAKLVALIREPPRGGSPARKGSLRSSDGLDASAIAREFGGGGHPQAAGFATDLTIEEITARIVAAAARDGAR